MPKEAIETHRVNGEKVEEKLCSTCKQWFALSLFSKRKASKDGLSYSCKTCERKTAMKSYKEGQKKRRAHKRYMDDREKVLNRSKKHYELNRESRLDQARAYRAAHPEVYRKADAQRRGRIKGTISDGVSRAEIIARDSIAALVDGVNKMVPVCQICKELILEGQIDVDHIVPLAAGGTDTADNKRTTHHLCNIKRVKDGRDL